MKTLLYLVAALFIATPLHADQALVLTEIEQIQEKIWYLQRDMAAQKNSLAEQQKTLKGLAARSGEDKLDIEQRMTALSELIESQKDRTLQVENNLQSLKEAVTALVNEFNQQNTAQLQQAEKSGAHEGLLQALRDDVASNREQTEQALAKTQQQLAETMARLEALQQDDGKGFDQLALYVGGAALALATMLTIGFAFLNSKSNRRTKERESLHKHEL